MKHVQSTDNLYDHLIGNSQRGSQQYGLIGRTVAIPKHPDAVTIGLELDLPHTIGIWGTMGSGKSYLVGVILEMLGMPIRNLNVLRQPLCTLIVHYARTEDHAPEWPAMLDGNSDEREVQALARDYGAEPQPFPRMVQLCPKGLVERRQQQQPRMETHPLVFPSRLLDAGSWQTLMGVTESGEDYAKAILRIMSEHREGLTLEILRSVINDPETKLSDEDRRKSNFHLDLASDFIDESSTIEDVIRPGACLLLDARDEYRLPKDSFSVVQVFLQIVANVRYRGQKFSKAILLDEAHNYGKSPELWDSLENTIRLMRHKRTSLIIASQNPQSIPRQVAGLCTMHFACKLADKADHAYLAAFNAAFDTICHKDLLELPKGHAYFTALEATDERFTNTAALIRIRSRATHHGGRTVKATETVLTAVAPGAKP